MARNLPKKKRSMTMAPSGRRGRLKGGNQRAALEKAEPVHIPLSLLKFGIGAFLLPVAWVLTLAILNVFNAGNTGSIWKSPEMVLFFTGLGLWSAYFLLFRQPTRVYVFGHELTHALFVILFFGKVGGFKVNEDSGYILSNKTNVWISLSPYFVPIYTLFSLSLLALINWAVPIPWIDRILFFSTGITWGFHLTFTLLMIQRGQSDLEENGLFFSLVLIYLLNLLQISFLLVVASSDVTLAHYAEACLSSAGEFSRLLLRVFNVEP